MAMCRTCGSGRGVRRDLSGCVRLSAGLGPRGAALGLPARTKYKITITTSKITPARIAMITSMDGPDATSAVGGGVIIAGAVVPVGVVVGLLGSVVCDEFVTAISGIVAALVLVV